MNGPHCLKSVRIRRYSGPHFPVFSPYAGKCGLYSIKYTCKSLEFHHIQVNPAYLLTIKQGTYKTFVSKNAIE